MMSSRPDSSLRRNLLVAALCLGIVILLGALAVILPILFHQSAGLSGQVITQAFSSSVTATGDDGRVRTLSVATADGNQIDLSQVSAGEVVTVTGTGFDAGIGIYVSICAIPESPASKPSPCLGGVPESALSGEASNEQTSSVWITNDWAWRNFASQTFDTATGDFVTQLVIASPVQEGLNCTEVRCAIAVRADHTASSDRVQDMLLPIQFIPE